MSTLTFLFTDIEGSTSLLRQFGDVVFSDVLLRHHRLIRDGLKSFEGSEQGTSGDAFFAVFQSTSASVAAAVALQKEFAAFDLGAHEHLAVRMGLHVGEASRSETGLVGYDVIRASRIAQAAHGGQVLLSSRAADNVAASLPSGVSLRDLGSYSLKGLERDEPLYQLVIEGLRSDFAPLRVVNESAVDALSFEPPGAERRLAREGRSVTQLLTALDGTISALGRITEGAGTPERRPPDPRRQFGLHGRRRHRLAPRTRRRHG